MRCIHEFALHTNENSYQGGGCLLDTSNIQVGQAFLIETVLSFCLMYVLQFHSLRSLWLTCRDSFLAFGVGLDPRQQQVFGPKFGPFLVGCTVALTSFSSIGLAPGYPGAGMNPARCFAFAVARGDFTRKFIAPRALCV